MSFHIDVLVELKLFKNKTIPVAVGVEVGVKPIVFVPVQRRKVK
jgi:hypothetical protein